MHIIGRLYIVSVARNDESLKKHRDEDFKSMKYSIDVERRII